MTTKLQDALPLRVKPRALLHVQIEMQHLDSTSGCELSAKVSTQQQQKRDYLWIFPNMGGGVFPIPKTQNQKKSAFKSP